MQKLLIIALSASLVIPTAVLAQGALASGKPAGVRAAQMDTTTTLFTVGILALAAIGRCHRNANAHGKYTDRKQGGCCVHLGGANAGRLAGRQGALRQNGGGNNQARRQCNNK